MPSPSPQLLASLPLFPSCPPVRRSVVSVAAHPALWFSASVLARLLALRAGPRQPQVQWAAQKRPCSTVVVRWSEGEGGS